MPQNAPVGKEMTIDNVHDIFYGIGKFCEHDIDRYQQSELKH